MLTLDTLSLLLSKHNPNQVSGTLSKSLRDMVGIGTLGADKLSEPKAPDNRSKDNETTSLGWTLKEIDKTRRSAEDAVAFLERENEAESRYWEQVISVQKKGWAVCKMPSEPSTLGVRFGFSEAAPEFRSNGLAPMRRKDNGVVNLDSGRLGGVSERILVTYERDGQVVGRSSLPAQTDETAPLDARVLEARNTLYSQELWYELGREARSLLAYDVRRENTRLRWDVDERSSVVIELVALGAAPSPAEASPADNLAEAISLTLHILLGHTHRHSEWLRTRPTPPHVPRVRGQQSHALLRPIIARMSHLRSVKACVRCVGSLSKTLANAGLGSSFHLSTPTVSVPEAAGPNQPGRAQQILHTLLQPADFSVSFAVVPGDPASSLTVRGRTLLSPYMATAYSVQLPPGSPLETLCPPHQEYPDVEALAGYVDLATTRLLTSHYLGIHQPRADNNNNNDDGDSSTVKPKWMLSLDAVAIQPPEADHPSLSFSLSAEALCVKHTPAQWQTGKSEARTWRWTPDGAASDGARLDEVVSQALSQA